jgi:hypothetical protein
MSDPLGASAGAQLGALQRRCANVVTCAIMANAAARRFDAFWEHHGSVHAIARLWKDFSCAGIVVIRSLSAYIDHLFGQPCNGCLYGGFPRRASFIRRS